MPIQQTVTFTPSRYRYEQESSLSVKGPGGTPLQFFQVIRESDGAIIALTYYENEAKQVCFSLELSQAMLRGEATTGLGLLRELEKVRD